VRPYELVFPEDFDDVEYEYEAKGYLTGLTLVIEGREVPLTVYDPTRLAQDIEDEVRLYGSLAVPNLLVVPKVTRDAVTDAVARLARGDFAEILIP
jgi:hypothetical protein